METKKYVFDTESDELALLATVVWIVVVKDLDTGERWEYPPGDLGWMQKLHEATHLIGHNIVQHDFPLLERLHGWKPRPDQRLQDTLIMSRALDYKRFGLRGHAMAVWGEAIGQQKQEHEDWSQYSEEMRQRCITDVDLNCKMYKILMDEFGWYLEQPNTEFLPDYLLAEHAASRWAGESHINGWPFDLDAALKLRKELEDTVESIRDRLQPKLGYKITPLDKVRDQYESKKAKWTMAGCYHAHTANYFGINPWSGFEGEIRPVIGEFDRVSVDELQLSSTHDMKVFLFRNGWVPFEWNTKWNPDTRKNEKTSPKITEDSLEFLGEDGALYHDYSVASSRLSILKNWIDGVDDDGNLHGDCRCIGTPSMRATHSGIVNVPAMYSKYGPEMRALFKTFPGWKLIGADSSGNQGRGLAFYLDQEEYTNILINEDIHMYNVEKIDTVLKNMGHCWSTSIIRQKLVSERWVERMQKFFHGRNDVTFEDYINSDRKTGLAGKIRKAKRAKAKRIYYAFLFGAGGPKLWGYAMGSPDEKLGPQLKDGFVNAVPGFQQLLDTLESEFKATKKELGWKKAHITSIAGNPVYVDSKHKLLVYLLQAFEKATCSGAIYLLQQYLEEENIPYVPHIFMHDEVDFSVPEEHAERAAELSAKAFEEGPKLFGVDIMAGEGQIGETWAEVH